MKTLNDANSQVALRLPQHEDRVQKLHKYVHNFRMKQEKQRDVVERKKQQLRKVIKTAASQLIEYIFPLFQVEPHPRYHSVSLF